jgi:glycerol-3-phosphate acyltransferase PlsY
VILFGYLIGSFPTALIVSRKMIGEDIRMLGDGNMGARNTTHVLGWNAGILVAVVDFLKGMIVLLISKKLNLPLGWQLAAGFFAVIGHDFPIFAHFRGGQGMATSLGAMSVLFTKATLIGLVLFALVYLILRNFDLSAGVGLGCMIFYLWHSQHPLVYIIYAIFLLLMIPAKKLWDVKHPFQKVTSLNA